MKSPRIMFFYAGFLFLAGFVAFAMAGFERRAATAIMMGTLTALLMTACGVMAKMLTRKPAVGMFGIHAGLVLPLLFSFTFLWRAMEAYAGWAAEEKPFHLPWLLGVMAIVSGMAFGAILMTRPPVEKRV
jgi:hypothetical protein